MVHTSTSVFEAPPLSPCRHGTEREISRLAHSFLIVAIFAVVGAVLSPTAYGKSAKEIFAEVSNGIVVVVATNARGKEVSRGSGVVVSANNVATNCHVISGADQIGVRHAANTRAQEAARMMAKLTAQAPERGLCLLFVAGLSESPTAIPIPLGNARDASIGDEVYAIGATENLDLSLSRGIVSYLRSSEGKGTAPVILTDAAILPRSSGGGLFDQQGKLIGITTLRTSAAGIRPFTPAIPAEWVAELARTVSAPETRLADLRALYSQTKEALNAEQTLSREAREQVRLLNLQIAALRQQLARIEAALEASEREAEAKGIQIVNLSQRLNAALVSKVQELASFRSEFFGRLKQALGDRRDVRIVGDRFVFQSEVLFPSGQATLQPGGRDQIDKLARTIKEISVNIPTDINWVLRVDGHTDRIPISTPAYPSNWELSTGRAVAVVKYLIDQGVPATRLAATGFGEFQPIDTGSTVAAFRRNRRIEFKLTQR